MQHGIDVCTGWVVSQFDISGLAIPTYEFGVCSRGFLVYPPVKVL